MMHRRLTWLVAVIGLLGVGIGVVIFHHEGRSKSGPSPTITAQLPTSASFIIYQPGGHWQLNRAAIYYKNNILTIQAESTAGIITINEQATPAIFSDVPEYYPTLVSRMNQYQSFGTINGMVYLTHPTELHGQQQAVLNNNGTLLFAHPTTDLTDDVWRQFFNDLTVVKP